MIDQLKQVIDHLQHLESASEDEQVALAQKIGQLIEEYENELKWHKLLSDPRSEAVLTKLAAEAESEVRAKCTRPVEELF